MEYGMNAIGFSNLEDEMSREILKAEVLADYTHSFVREYSKGKIILEAYKEYADNIYVLLRTKVISGRLQEEFRTVETCEPFIETGHVLDIKSLQVKDKNENKFKYYATCEEKETGTHITFQVQNVIEYFDCLEDNLLDYIGISIAGVATEGTIVLPLEENENEVEHQVQQREYLQGMLQKAKTGDGEAFDRLQKEKEHLDRQFIEKLYKKDVLSLIGSYFSQTKQDEVIYSVLGVIKHMETRQNKKTKEKLYWMFIDTVGFSLNIVINAKDLVGQPYVGMRFMGTCKIQGKIAFEFYP